MADYDPDRLMTERPTGPVTVRAVRLNRDDAERLVRKYNPDITQGAVKGEVDNIMRESGGKSAVPGDFDKSGRATSGGMYQHHNKRLDELKSYASKHGTDWTDPEIQIQFSRMEKERDYPGLLKLQQTVDDRGRNEDAFKRIFERPASVLWQNNASGEPVLGNDRFRFSDYAMKEHDGRPGTDIRYMQPADYLDLSPDLEHKPFDSPSGRSLMRSFNRGEPIEAIPTLDMNVEGNTGTVTAQDGRHRALLAQQEGVDAIPVAIRQKGEGTPTEIQGMSGKLLPNDFVERGQLPRGPRQEPQEPAPKEPISLLGKIGNAIIPSAQAAEANPFMADLQQAQPKAAAPANPFLADLQGAAPQPDNMVMSTIGAIGKGFGDTVLGAEELVGKGMQAAGIPGGETLTQDARTGVARLEKENAANRAAHPFATGAGEFLGGLVAPLGIAGKAVKAANALRSGAAAGAIGAAMTPSGTQPGQKDDRYWRDKAAEVAIGTGAGAALGAVGNALAKVVKPNFEAAVKTLMGEGVTLTPGQMAGGKLKRMEDALSSHPLMGNQVREAQRKSIETFNRAAINRSLDDIGAKLPPGVDAGHDAIEAARKSFSDAYDMVIPRMRGALDRDFMNDLNAIGLKAQSMNLPQGLRDELMHIIKSEILEPFRAGAGRITGTDTQKIGTMLDDLVRTKGRDKSPYERDLAKLLREADTALDKMMARNNPLLQAAKDRIDAGYAKFKIVQDAASGAGGRADGVFSPNRLSMAVRRRDTSKDKRAFSEGAALLQDLSGAASQVLPQVVRDSGTAERTAFLGLMGLGGGGLAWLNPAALGAAAVAAAPYTAAGSKGLNWALNKLSANPMPRTQNALANVARGGAQALAPVAGAALAPTLPQQPGMQ
ncbi:MAG TPA: phage tail tip lysozyme [Verrucomicrobiae bacterium]|nr:phage tail tip lysozyme [Verrucomicrobiae bacterium]